jgi:hypothetical protein
VGEGAWWGVAPRCAPQAELELVIFLPQPPECWDYRLETPRRVGFSCSRAEAQLGPRQPALGWGPSSWFQHLPSQKAHCVPIAVRGRSTRVLAPAVSVYRSEHPLRG